MKGTLMFDNVNDLVFFKADKPLLMHLHRLMVKEGLVQDSNIGSEGPQVDRNAVLQLFAPLLASYKVIQCQLNDSYHSIEMENGISLMFHEILNFIVIGLRATEELSFLEWEIKMFSTFVFMLYGPSLYLMKEPLLRHSGITRLHFLSIIMDKCQQVKKELQMFLVEAVERFIVKPETAAMCVEVLQEALHKIRTAHNEGIFSHSFLLVDHKLLALYSSRNSDDLPKDQLLLLIILANVLNKKLSNSDEVFFSEHQRHSSITSEITPEEDKAEENAEINSSLVFLNTTHCHCVPHMVYVMKITCHITLVILCELAGIETIASQLSSLVEMFQFYRVPSIPRSSYQSIASLVKNLAESAKKLQQVPSEKEKYIRNIVAKWELAKQNGIQEFLQSKSQDCPEPRLDSTISSLCEAFNIAFGEVITRPELAWEQKCLHPEYRDTFNAVLAMASKRLKGSLKYLEPEVDNNLWFSHMADFPGLVHFIYIDRSSDSIIALSPIPSGNEVGMSMRTKIWNMVEFGRKHVDGSNGFFCLWHMGNLHYFYSIWFEDSNGKRITPAEIPDLKDLPMKGILCGNFFKQLIQKCFPNASYEHIYCYELFCTYLETTSASEVMHLSRRLSARLWEFSGACKTPLDLL